METVASELQALGIYNPIAVDAAMAEWEEFNYPKDSVDGLVFVGSPASMSSFQNP